jgi:hypothetical protein
LKRKRKGRDLKKSPLQDLNKERNTDQKGNMKIVKRRID